MSNDLNKFIEVKADPESLRQNQWFKHCRQKNIPYVVVTLKTKFADVLWDYISYSAGSDQIFSQSEAYLKVEFYKIYCKYGKENSAFDISCAKVNFSDFLIEDAKAAASDIFDLVNDLIKTKT